MKTLFLSLLFLTLTAVSLGADTDNDDDDDNTIDEETTSVSEAIARANEGISTRLQYDDIRPNWERNASPCTSRGCKWRKQGRYVHVPVIISSRYTRSERRIIIEGLLTFHRSTCIRFVWRKRWHRNYLYFFSGTGCWSYLGRQRIGQRVSLKKNGCLHKRIVQHEVLHALGFHHEQVRSDRDDFVSIFPQNIQTGRERNFRKVATNNLGTPYDYNSVMHYSRYAFSKNGRPTIVPKGNPNQPIGKAMEMSTNDINRVNRLYQCRV